MNLITDTLNEIRSMKFRKVLYIKVMSVVNVARTELWDDCVLCPHDLEDSHGCHKHREPCCRRT